MRGDDEENCDPASTVLGTGPRARGRRAMRRPSRWSRWEQPRVRGDDHRIVVQIARHNGTAPRARGRPSHCRPDRSPQRNSPACAGTTPSSSARPRGSPEQPRVRGDDGRAGYRKLMEARNSPACAGTTAVRDCWLWRAAEQPRVRGDDEGKAYQGQLDTEQPRVRGDDDSPYCRKHDIGGTAPRARGRRRCPPASRASGRNSPACAGTTCRAATP